MSLPALIFWSLVVWRTTVLLVYDGITAPLRDAVGVQYDEFSECKGNNILASALCCHHCTSIWVALLATFFVQPSLRDVVPTVLALSAGSIAMNKLVMGE